MLILHNLSFIPERTNTLMTQQYGGGHAALFEMSHEKQSTLKCARTKQNK
jgi:hypothetical protein